MSGDGRLRRVLRSASFGHTLQSVPATLVPGLCSGLGAVLIGKLADGRAVGLSADGPRARQRTARQMDSDSLGPGDHGAIHGPVPSLGSSTPSSSQV